MVNRLVQFLRASGAPGETVDAWLPAPSPFQDQDSPRCRTGRAHWVLGGGQKRECQNQWSDRKRDRDKSLERILTMQRSARARIRYAWFALRCQAVPSPP